MRVQSTTTLATLLLLAGCQKPPGGEPATADDGRTLYLTACARCHGTDGSGGVRIGHGNARSADLRDRAWQARTTDAGIAKVIDEGRGAMPGFAEALSDAERASLVRHVRTLGGQR